MWEDLRSTDPTAASAFYSKVFGFRVEGLEDAPPDYSLFSLGEEPTPLGGIGGMMDEPDGTSSHWLVYFSVVDADAAAQAATDAGGTVLAPPVDTPYGRMVPITDPWGATFMITQARDDAVHPDRAG
jgi:predicted enzyme related to lactoylglutathione lyase